MGRKIPATLIACGIAATIFPAAAWAQGFQTEPMLPIPILPVAPNAPVAPGTQGNVPLDRGLTVVDRPRPEIDPLGVRMGGFFLFPSLELDEAYNDNIAATQSGKLSDFITIVQPTLNLRSNFGQNMLNLSAGGAFSFYADHTSFNSKDGFGAADGRIDVDATHDIHGGLRIERTHEDPGNPNVPGGINEPIRLTAYNATAGFAQTKLRIGYSADVTARREEYDAVTLVGGGTLPQSDRNNNSYEGAVRAYYEFVPNYQAFIRGAYNVRDYDHAAIGSFIRDSKGYRADIGARIDLTGVTFAEFYVGYISQNYKVSSFGTISGLDAGANLVWNVTQLTSITLKGLRTIEDAAAANAVNSPGFLHSTIGLSLDHELLRDLLVNATAAYSSDKYEGVSRTDKYYDLGGGMKYFLNRHLYVGANYFFERRNSTGSAAINPYSRNIFLLRISTQL